MTMLRRMLLIVGILLLIVLVVLFLLLPALGSYRSDPAHLRDYPTDNPHIVSETEISSHRSGGGIAPEQTLRALRTCAESEDFTVDTFEFDLHLTRDGVLVLLHDETLDRVSDSAVVFGEQDVRPEEKDYAELRTLNMGAQFVAADGSMPYAGLHGEAVPEDLRILSLSDAFKYLANWGEYKFILEIKNEGELGRCSVDRLWEILEAYGLVDRVVVGTFHAEISDYLDEAYPLLARSASVAEVAAFWLAALTDSDSYTPPCRVLQIPFTEEYLRWGVNLGTTTVVNYAHRHNMAVQYWTINDPEEMAYLASIGADCIMTDYPDRLYALLHRAEESA